VRLGIEANEKMLDVDVLSRKRSTTSARSIVIWDGQHQPYKKFDYKHRLDYIMHQFRPFQWWRSPMFSLSNLQDNSRLLRIQICSNLLTWNSWNYLVTCHTVILSLLVLCSLKSSELLVISRWKQINVHRLILWRYNYLPLCRVGRVVSVLSTL